MGAGTPDVERSSLSGEDGGGEVRERLKSWVVDTQGGRQTALLLLAPSPGADILL